MSKHYDPVIAVKAAATLIDEINSHGLTVSSEHDFAMLELFCEEIDGKELSEQFSTKFFDISPGTGFWLAARDKQNHLVSMQAARIENLSGYDLAEHWAQQQRRIYVDPHNQPAGIGKKHCPAAKSISGNVVYHGDMWLDGIYRGGPLASLLTRLGQMVAYMKWQPDYIYCFMSEKLVQRGFSTGQGYFHMQPFGTDWISPPHHIHADDWMCWNSLYDLHYLALTLSK